MYAGLVYNGRGLAIAAIMGKRLALAVVESWVEILMERLKPITLRRFYNLGTATRNLSGGAVGISTPRLRRKSFLQRPPDGF